MPRPAFKRRKFNAPARNKRARLNGSPVINPQIVRQELETKLRDKPIGVRPSDSDDSDELVRKVRNLRDRRGLGSPRQEIFASGGVVKTDVPGSHPSRKRRSSAAQPNLGIKLHTVTNDIHSDLPQTKSTALLAHPAIEKPKAKPLPNSARPSPLPVATKSILVATTPLHGTQSVSASILASLKPRRRLPSILKLADGQDSSSLNVDDEAEFLPDDESTPLNLTKTAAAVSTPQSSLSLQSNSRKRKITPLVDSEPTPSEDRADRSMPGSIVQTPSSLPTEPELPHLPASVTKSSKRKAHPETDDDIMAPPESSSSPAPNSAKTQGPSPVKSKRTQKTNELKTLSTEALQALMPKRPKVRQQRRKAATEFDIPSDESPLAGSDDDEQSFIPPGRGNKKARRKETAKSSKTRKKIEAKAEGRNERATSSTLSPTKNTRLRDRITKSPSQQPPRPRSTVKSSSTATKSYSSRHPQPARRGRALDKENRLGALSRDSLGVSDGDDGESENGNDDLETPSAGLKAIKAKFAQIDDWDMEFEEVEDMSSSDPMMR